MSSWAVVLSLSVLYLLCCPCDFSLLESWYYRDTWPGSSLSSRRAPRQTCHGRGANLRPPAQQAAALPKELSRQLIRWLFGTSTWPGARGAAILYSNIPVCPWVPLRAANRKRSSAVHWLTTILKMWLVDLQGLYSLKSKCTVHNTFYMTPHYISMKFNLFWLQCEWVFFIVLLNSVRHMCRIM